MKPLYTQAEFERAKTHDKLPCECYHCKKKFYKKKNLLLLTINNFTNKNGKTFSGSCKFCSRKCQFQAQIKKQKVTCKNCKKEFEKTEAEVKRFPNHFCGRSCAVTYNNTHKQHGTRRSKLEIYLEEQLTSIYPNLSINFNKKDAINSELDIYIPSLKLAFELNGIFHYEPIYGSEKLAQIQNNDQRKFQACLEKNIELVLIDVSTFEYFKKERADKFLHIITSIINQKFN